MECVKMEQLSLDCVKQYKVYVPDEFSKIKLITERIIHYGKTDQMIMYVHTKESAKMLHEALVESEMLVSTVHGDLTQEDRDETVMLFNTTCNHILVTDALAEGVDQSMVCILPLLYLGGVWLKVNLVVNYDLPIVDNSSEEKEPDTRIYLQRFCSMGVVFNLLCGDTDKMVMEKIERRLHHVVTEVPSWTSYKDVRLAFIKAGMGVAGP